MKRLWILLSLSGALAGCGQVEPISKSLNGWTVDASVQREIQQAVVAEQTLYPYHFEPGSPKLSELGAENLRILADRYRTDGGELSIRRQGADETLYRKRVDQVKEALAGMGVDASRIRMVDRPPLGEGMPSSEVITILKQKPTQFTENYAEPIITNIIPENSQ